MASGRTAEGGLCHSERASVQEAGQAARQHQQPVRAVGVLHTPLRIGAVRPRTSQQQPVGYASHASHASTLVADRLRRLAQALCGHHPISKPLHQL